MATKEFLKMEGGNVCLHIWEPQGDVRALYQICHGMAEYVMRYDEFARALNEKGYLVFGIDHPGHGDSEGVRGHFADKDGWTYLCECNVKAAQTVKERYPGKKLTLMGHSMGSFVARTIAARYKETADDYIFMGTAGPNPAAGAGIALATVMMPSSRRKENKFLGNLSTGVYGKAEKTYKTPLDWLNTNDDEVQKYIADENCGFNFTTAGYRDLLTGLKFISSKKWAEMLDKEKRYLIVSGDRDPVGDMAKGVKVVYERMKDAGLNVEMKLYSGYRHEILNDACKNEVTDDIISFLEEQ